jgi:pimeloyl-ACP methyl ester carboxylesterase
VGIGGLAARIGHLAPTTWVLPDWAASVANGFLLHQDVGTDTRTYAMTVRLNGRRVELARADLAAAYPASAPRLVVFVHGLADNEMAWFHRDEPHKHRSGTDFGSRLARELRCSAVYVRYDTGRHVSDSGTDLVRLLSDLVRHWPQPVREIVLIGHSLGGLVVRSAIHQARYRRLPWLSRVTGVICIGTPHAGARVERAAAWAAAQLGRHFATAPLSRLLELRSGAVRDLGYGYLHEYQWSTGLTKLPSKDRATLTRFPATVPQLFVYATVSRSESRWGRVLGDLVVGAANAGTTGHDADLRWLGGLNHIDLLRHDSVYDAMLDWLRARRRRPSRLTSANGHGRTSQARLPRHRTQ